MEKDSNPKDAIGTAKWRQFFCVPMQVLWEVGVGMLEGTLKYGRHNYRGAGVRASVYVDAALGHIHQFVEGEDIDEDSGLSHITKAICSLFVLRDAQMNDFWVDDRPPKIKDLGALRDRLQTMVAENFERYADKDPHHYSHEEDGAPYHGGSGRRPTIEEDVLTRFKSSTQYAEMLVEEQSRRDMQAKSVAEMAETWSPDLEKELQKALHVGGIMLPGRGSGKISRVGDVAVTDFEWEEPAVDKIQIGIDRARGYDDLPTEPILFGHKEEAPSLEACQAHLEDPMYLPSKPLACLSDNDPSQILWLHQEHPEYNKAHIVEALTQEQFNRLMMHEADQCGYVVENHKGDTLFWDGIARRVLLRVAGRHQLWHTLTWDNATARRYSRLLGAEWQIAIPDLVDAVPDTMPRSFA